MNSNLKKIVMTALFLHVLPPCLSVFQHLAQADIYIQVTQS